MRPQLRQQIINAIDQNDPVLVKTLIQGKSGFNLMEHAVNLNSFRCLDMLALATSCVKLKEGNSGLWNILKLAFIKQHWECIHVLFRRFAPRIAPFFAQHFLSLIAGDSNVWIQDMIDRGIFAKLPHADKVTAVAEAILRQQLSVARALIDVAQFPVCYNFRNVRESKDVTRIVPIVVAAKIQNLEMMDFLVQRGANVNDEDCHGCALSVAAECTHSADMLNWLLEKGATDLKSAIKSALSAANPLVLKVLLNRMPIELLYNFDETEQLLSVEHDLSRRSDCQNCRMRKESVTTCPWHLQCTKMLIEHGLCFDTEKAIGHTFKEDHMRELMTAEPDLRETGILSKFLDQFSEIPSRKLKACLQLILNNSLYDLNEVNSELTMTEDETGWKMKTVITEPPIILLLDCYHPEALQAICMLLDAGANPLQKGFSNETCLQILLSRIEPRYGAVGWLHDDIESLVNTLVLKQGVDTLLGETEQSINYFELATQSDVALMFLEPAKKELIAKYELVLNEFTDLCKDSSVIVIAYCFGDQPGQNKRKIDNNNNVGHATSSKRAK